MCEMRSGTLLTGGGKDRKIILWDHELRPDRDIEVLHTHPYTLILFDLTGSWEPCSEDTSLWLLEAACV